MLKYLLLFLLFCFFGNVFTRQILFDNMGLEILVCRAKATLEIKKRHGNSRKKFATEKEIFLDCRKKLIVLGKFKNLIDTFQCLFLQTVEKLSNSQCRFL